MSKASRKRFVQSIARQNTKMGKEKGGFLSPKAIANRIKSKGLQKLRWYCQMCHKQCRDENGFKCHTTSESHQRQLLLFADNPDKYIDSFSQEFLDDFLELLRRRFGTKRVQANIVYQEYISHKEHTHMNSTQWETLTQLVKWLGKEGHCVVDETEKGWYMAYVDRDPEAIKRQEAAQKKEKMELDDEERTAKFVAQQIEKAAAGNSKSVEATVLKRDADDEKVVLSMGSKSKTTEKTLPHKSSAIFAAKSRVIEEKKIGSSNKSAGTKRKSALDEIMEFEEKKKEKMNRKDYWLFEGIIVKVVTKKLGNDFYKKKGVVREVKDNFCAVVKMIDSGKKIQVDQSHMETVIPAIGKDVLIVNGAYRGTNGRLLSMNEQSFTCNLKLLTGPHKGSILDNIEYEDISKLA